MVQFFKNKLFLFLVLFFAFVSGFFLRGKIINQTTTIAPTIKPKNILLPEAKEGKYKVVRVLDGDTIVIETGEKVRYQGIDSPEQNQRWGEEAKKFNEGLVLGKKVRIEFDRVKLDKYGRLLAYVWVDQVLVNEKLLEEGYAKINLIQGEAKLKYLERFQKAEIWAKEHHNGVWLDEWIGR